MYLPYVKGTLNSWAIQNRIIWKLEVGPQLKW